MSHPIPDATLQQHIAILGKTRSGKSSVARMLVERLLDLEKPVCIIDPKGDWWGIKLARDGKRAGYPVVIFGGEHADVPINAHAGAHVAELFATGNRPCLIDLGGWMVGDRTRFWVEFASTLFRHTKGMRWLVVDECHNFAPKGKVMDPDSGKALHWMNRLASEGLGKGVPMIFASQRPQKVHNDTLTSAETLIAMRVLHPSDRGAVSDWIKGCGDLEVGAKVLGSLAEMKRGEGWAWSPEIDFGPVRVQFPLFKTYDSFRPQTAEDAKSLKGWAEVDLDDVRAKLATVVKEAEANDPAKLKARIRELEKQASASASRKPAAAASAPKVDHATRKQDAATIARLERALEEAMKFIVEINTRDFVAKVGESVDPQALEKAISSAVSQAMKLLEAGQATRNRELLDLKAQSQRLIERVNKLRQDNKLRVAVDVRHNEPFTVAAAAPPVRRASNGASENPEIAGLGKRILDALAWLAAKGIEPAPRETTAAVARVKPSGGYYARIVGQLKTTEYISYPQDGYLQLTDKGCKFADPGDGSGDVHEQWLEILSGLEQKIVAALIDRHPASMTREELGAATNTDAQGGYFARVVGHLKTLGALEYPQAGTVALTRYVMP